MFQMNLLPSSSSSSSHAPYFIQVDGEQPKIFSFFTQLFLVYFLPVHSSHLDSSITWVNRFTVNPYLSLNSNSDAPFVFPSEFFLVAKPL
jgi:hypothetical protein